MTTPWRRLVLSMLLLPALSYGKVINGDEIVVKEDTSFNVFIGLDDTFSCTGSLISPTFILTAGHCLQGTTINSLSLASGSAVKFQPKMVANLPKPRAFYIHPEFNGANADVALIELSSPVNSSFKPVPLFGSQLRKSTNFSAEIYGYSPYTKSKTDNLLSYNREEHPENVRANLSEEGIIKLHGKALSAFLTTDEKFPDIALLQPHGGICGGDSGGALTMNVEGKKVLVGIHRAVLNFEDTGSDCTSMAYATPVYEFIPWIKATMASNVETKSFKNPEHTYTVKNAQEACTFTQAAMFNIFHKFSDSIRRYRCDKELISLTTKGLIEAQKYCVSALTKDYPRMLDNSLEMLKKQCD